MSIHNLFRTSGTPTYDLQMKSLTMSQESGLNDSSDNTTFASGQFPLVNATGTNVLVLTMAATGISSNSLYVKYRITAITGSSVQLRTGTLTMSSICVTGTAIASSAINIGTSTAATVGTLSQPTLTAVSSANTSTLKMNTTSSLTNPEILCDLIVTSQNTPEISYITFP